MSASLYSQQKAAYHQDRLVQIGEGRTPPPVHLHFILSDLCNQDCSFCAYRMSSGLSSELFKTEETHNPNRKIPTRKAEEILLDAAALGVKAVQFTGGGEPTVHPDHLHLFGRAQALGMETALVTNGVKLDPFAESVQRMTWIRVSVDSGDAEMYGRVRRVPPQHWTKMWANVANLAANFKGTLGIGYVITPENYEGLLDCARMAKAAGASNMRVGAVFSADGLSYYPDGMVRRIADSVQEVKQQTDGDGFTVIDLFGRRIGDLEAGHPDFEQCAYQYMTWYIGGDLNLYRCCNVAYTKNGLVTSLADKRLVDVISTRAHEPFDARSCLHCQFLGQNKTIHALMTPPEHVNFV